MSDALATVYNYDLTPNHVPTRNIAKFKSKYVAIGQNEEQVILLPVDAFIYTSLIDKSIIAKMKNWSMLSEDKIIAQIFQWNCDALFTFRVINSIILYTSY